MKMKLKKIDMKTKQLGNSDLFITPIGFGAWAIGGSGWEFGWGEQDDEVSVAAIHRALELGVNWIDTAAVYGMGHSEEVVATALRNWPGPRPYVFTKCGLRWDEQGYVHRSLNADSIRRECEDSLRRLDVDVIDLYQVHWPTEDLDEGWSAMAQLQKEGKIRWIGVSNFDVEELRRAQKIAPITSLQPPYSLVRREVEQEVLPYCRSNEIGVIVYSPKVAIAWTLRDPAVTGAIVGARNAKQVEGNVDAATLRLTNKEIAEIEGKDIYQPELVTAA